MACTLTALVSARPPSLSTTSTVNTRLVARAPGSRSRVRLSRRRTNAAPTIVRGGDDDPLIEFAHTPSPPCFFDPTQRVRRILRRLPAPRSQVIEGIRRNTYGCRRVAYKIATRNRERRHSRPARTLPTALQRLDQCSRGLSHRRYAIAAGRVLVHPRLTPARLTVDHRSCAYRPLCPVNASMAKVLPQLSHCDERRGGRGRGGPCNGGSRSRPSARHRAYFVTTVQLAGSTHGCRVALMRSTVSLLHVFDVPCVAAIARGGS